jgi:hypothetical protein
MAIRYNRPWLYPKQLAAVFNACRYSFIEASTKAGKTHACLIWLFEKALFGQENTNYWWVAPVFSQAEIAFKRMKIAIPNDIYTKNETKMTITLPGNRVIWFKSGDKPDSLYGDDVVAVVVDEASRTKNEVFFALRSVITATRGMLRAIGNVKGRKNWFFLMCRQAQQGAKDMQYHKITAYDAASAGIITFEEIEDAKRILPDHIFRELYLAEPSDDGGNPFGIDAIRACIVAHLSTAPIAAWGWDLAKSVDYTYGVALDKDGCEVKSVRFQKPWEETIATIKRETGKVPALIDSTGVGDPIVERLIRETGGKGVSPFEGFKFTSTSKQQLLEGLAVGIQQRELRFTEGELVNELEQFEYEYYRGGVKYSSPPGLHDDGVMALALAKKKLSQPKPLFYYSM